MAFDQPTRNRLARFVGEARAVLTEEFTRQLQHEYGLDPEHGEVTELAKLTQLDDARRETARILRDTLAHYLAGQAAPTAKVRQEALDRLVREQAFTVLNRLCALRMAEARGLLIESIAKGYQSRGFQLYARLAGTALGETGEAYCAYLFSLFDEFSVDLAVLFDRFSPQGRLFPRASTLLQLLAAINHADLEPLWAEDETIGWIYQYFNSKEERKAMRDASQAPRNSRELAVRNQFFTPRYVVEFLTDNTLGRIWYEMTQGRTSLVDSCRYLVRRPNEIFLNEGEEAPTDKVTGGQGDQDLTQEELLRQPVYIPFRQIKDPRTILMLDPACGSMHFGLYSFDLYEWIYEEAWEIEGELGAHAFQRPAAMAPLRERYPDKASFLRDVPRLIIEYNIHGIDIDPRAVQIAGLSLWLRAQKSWQAQGIKPHERPTIRKANIVCAEPMPGDKALLEEFLQGLRDDRLEALIRRVLAVPENQRVRATPTMADALCDLVRKVWEEMKLAGEAGSLLKIEESLAEAIAKGRAEWEEKMPLFRVETFRMTEEKPKVNYVKVVPGEGVDFWARAEVLVLAALEEYVWQADDGNSYQRRLFAEDAGRGFAFIDLCRKQYDIALMNPPFGAVSTEFKEQFEKVYPRTKTDLYAAFIERSLSILVHAGVLGAITSRTGFFLTSFEKWRKDILLCNAQPTACVDLGYGVLDSAMVETAAYCIQRSIGNKTTFVRLLDDNEKSSALDAALASLHGPVPSPSIFHVDPMSFRQVPGSPFAYWFSDNIRKIFDECSTLENPPREARRGSWPGNDFRYLRLWFEVQPTTIGRSLRWNPYAKGGDFSTFYYDFPLVVDWDDNRKTFRGFFGRQGRPSARPESLDYYFRPGISWPLRTILGMNVRVLPEGFVFSNVNPSVFDYDLSTLLKLLALMNSKPFKRLLDFFQGAAAFQVGVIQRTPVPTLNNAKGDRLYTLALSCIDIKRDLDTANELGHIFCLPELLQTRRDTLNISTVAWQRKVAEATTRLTTLQSEIDNLSFQLYGIEGDDRRNMEERLIELHISDSDKSNEEEIEDATEATMFAEVPDFVSSLISYLTGGLFGRWDVRFATTDKSAPQLLDPFARLPVCPPGMLQNMQGLPATPVDISANYPFRISWSGILVNDAGNSEDIELRVREVLRIIWPDRADTIEQEACEILGVASLRAYFANPSRFFDDHLKRYSKSRRAAPIYWPLSTPSGSYTLWIYYHRLTDQTLYSCVNDFVEPKLKQVNGDVDTLRRRANRSRQEEKDLEQLSELALELAAFRDELLRIARFWQPNLNDGVQITAAPLWRLFQHRGWQKRLKETWTALEAGDYDWAHLAYSIWPERVREKCKTDKSLAIAHDLEQLYVEPVKAKKGGGKKQVVDEDEQGELL